MTRHENDTVDPREAAELEALEAALAGSTADPEWAALVAAVRAEPPVAGDRARASLDARVAAGFPRESRRPGWLRLPSRGKLLPALAATSALVIGGVVLGTGSSDRSGSDASVSAVELAPSTSGPEAAAPSAGLADSSSSRRADAVPPGRRSVERTASLELTTGARKLQDAADRIVRATQDLGGVVGSSRVSGGPSGGNADFELRVPAARLDDALKRFGEIASVSRLTQGSDDITDAVVSSKDQRSDARAERTALLKALGKAKTEQEISSLRSRIRINRSQIARLDADLRSLERRSTMATVQVSLVARGGAASTPEDGGSWGPAAAARTALRVLEVAAGVLLVGVAILVPLLLLALLTRLGSGTLRRRRRTAALGPS